MEINGYPLKCPHCSSSSYMRSKAQLNTAMMSFFGLDWLNEEAVLFTCKTCGKIEWFSYVQDASHSEELEATTIEPGENPDEDSEESAEEPVEEAPEPQEFEEDGRMLQKRVPISVKPPEIPAEEDPGFHQWREDNPEIQKRDPIDQIALYRDFQNGR